MATLVWLTGFEYGLAAPSTSGGGICDTKTGLPVIQSAVKRTGGYALQCNTSAASAELRKNLPASQTYCVARFYLRFASFPTSAGYITTLETVVSTHNPKVWFDPADNKIGFGCVDTPTSTKYPTALQLNTWYRIDIKAYVGGTTYTIDAQVDGDAITQYTASGEGATTYSYIGLGWYVANTGNMYVDDVAVSVTSGDYPIGAGGVLGLRPNADGTHNNAANIMEDSAGNDIDGVTYMAFDKLDENPWITTANADYVRQTATEITKYCEIQFADISESVIHGVIGILQYASATTTANNGKTYVRDSDSQETTIYSNDMSETSAFYKSAIILTPSGGWTQAYVNSLRARFGYSSDADPDPYWLAMIIEVAYGVAAGNNYDEAPANAFSSSPALAPSTFLAISPSLGAFISTPTLARSAQADLVGGITLASTPALSRAAVADFFTTLTLPSNPAVSMMGGMDLFNVLTLLSGPAASMAHNLGIFPSLTLLSNPALSPSALADFYSSISLASTPAAVMAAIANLYASRTLSSSPAFSAIGGSDFYNTVTFTSGPALANSVFMGFFPAVSLLSNPALNTQNIATLLAAITLSSNPALTAAGILSILLAVTLASNPAFVVTGGSDFYNSIAFLSGPGLSSTALKEAFPSLTLSSGPAFAAVAIADLLAAITVASSPVFSTSGGFDFLEGLILASGGTITTINDLVRSVLAVGAKRAASGLGRMASEAMRREPPEATRRKPS